MRSGKYWTSVICLSLMTVMGGSRLWAATSQERQQADELKAKMKAEGWQEISEGVFERQLGANKVEHLGYGREGLSWTIGELNRQLESLRKENETYPSEKLAKIIDDLTYKSAKARHELWRMEQGPAKGLSSVTAAVAGASCSSICYSATADAYALTSPPQGVGAIADATFNSTCGYSGDTYAYAYSRATLSGTTTTVSQSDPHTGTSVSSHAAATVYGGSVTGIPCYSEASSYAQSSALGISYSTSDTNSSCPAPPACTVTINGTTFEYFTGPGCRSRTFTATVSGCTATSYQWKIGSTVVGTGSTYTKSICPGTASFTLQLTINGTTSDTHDVEVFYEPCECCGGGICP
jgi:hypothetical protein